MALFSSDNDDKKLSQGSQVKSSSLLSSKNTDGSALNRATSTVKTLNQTSSSPFATSSTARTSSFASTATRPTGISSQTPLGSTRPLGSTLTSTAQSSASRFQSSSTLNRSTAGTVLYALQFLLQVLLQPHHLVQLLLEVPLQQVHL